MKWTKAVYALLVLVFSAVALTGCGSSEKEQASSSAGADKVYTIACDAKFAPFSMEVDGNYKGIDVELLAAIAKEEGFKYTLKPMDFSGIIPGLVSGQIDGGIAGMSITDERKKAVDFSLPYISSGYAIVVNKNDTSIKTLDDIKGKTAAVKKGTMGSNFAEENKDKYGLKITYYDDSPGMMMAVVNGNADFLVEDYPVISYQVKIGKEKDLKVAVDSITSDPPQYGFAVKKNENSELLRMFNDGLKKIKENGTYDKILSEYL